MKITEWSPNQIHLAEIIKRGKKVTDRDRVRAHRLWHGAKPKEQEIQVIYEASNGLVDANSFYELEKKTKSKTPNKLTKINENGIGL